jgi:hypothetical protein
VEVEMPRARRRIKRKMTRSKQHRLRHLLQGSLIQRLLLLLQVRSRIQRHQLQLPLRRFLKMRRMSSMFKRVKPS